MIDATADKQLLLIYGVLRSSLQFLMAIGSNDLFIFILFTLQKYLGEKVKMSIYFAITDKLNFISLSLEYW